MTHNKKKQDLLYFKGIVDEYHIDLKVSTKGDELFDYAEIPSYMKSRKHSEKDRDKGDYEMSL